MAKCILLRGRKKVVKKPMPKGFAARFTKADAKSDMAMMAPKSGMQKKAAPKKGAAMKMPKGK